MLTKKGSFDFIVPMFCTNWKGNRRLLGLLTRGAWGACAGFPSASMTAQERQTHNAHHQGTARVGTVQTGGLPLGLGVEGRQECKEQG